MRLLLQRVSSARVDVEGETVGRIGPGLLVLAGFGPDDALDFPESGTWRTMVDKVLGLRIFPDQEGKMNLSLVDYGGSILTVSQFTLYADCRKGRRPSFTDAAKPETAEALYDALCVEFARGLGNDAARGRFGALMDVHLVNWGPVTVMLDSREFGG